ncbi:MAG: hypothetical protein IPN01_02870 [Deltaproteobacteria bacterium]|nr:hypothetical protein [Deltaproteobacteria bacterium]
MPDSRWRAAIRECLEALGRLAGAGRTVLEDEPNSARRGALDALRRDELKLTRKGLYDALNHPITLVGYFDGFEARTALRERLISRLDAEGEAVDLEHLQSMIEVTCDLIAAVFLSLLERPRLDLVSPGPHSPGPDRTLALCQAHLAGLTAKVSTLGAKA